MKVQILSRKLITPSSPTPQHLQSLKISYLDQLAPPFYVPRLFCYLPSNEEQGSLNTGEKSEQLQNSLSETLTLFYPLAGRYIKDKLLVDCNDKGAEYLEAQVGCSLSQLLREGRIELQSEWLYQLVPNPEESDTTPLVMIQFNMFECGGVAVGVSVAHRVADGSAVFTFIDSWAKISRMGIGNIQSCPSFKLGSILPQRDVPTPQHWIGVADHKLTRKRLVFNAAAISSLKAIVTSSSSTIESLKYQPTRVEVVLAFLWMSLIRLAKTRHGHLRPSLLLIPVNMRNKTMLPIPENSCGNFIAQAIPSFFPDDNDEQHDKDNLLQLHEFVGKVHDAIKSTVSKCAKVSSVDDIVSLVNENGELLKSMDKPDVEFCISSSWCGFPKYEADFGWGKPAWVHSPMRPKDGNVIVLMDTKDRDGIEAWATLDKSGMHIFEQDREIMPFFCQQVLP
ncbi:hypothetical protein Tsubulata_019979 [Turnera subulata]|uniref:Uncharacterized protein n=1 Tax=Turnera subulata TaxID=218843 RepID=A0A9Q0JN40_9ROSI|nr:hypothetical protein Tsubulata_019979 [Turnera subulata]